ncbi:MAG: DUF2520 domain-containing protein [Planctomycetota bacterium]|nr:MAG: DUF2520 domain-containing protein [Planctomycetota bacterium]
MERIDLAIIGAGRVGRSLGRLLVRADCVRSVTVYDCDPQAARQAAAFIGDAQAVSSLAALPAATTAALTVPDDAITRAAAALAESDAIPTTVFHTSGAHDSGLLQPLAERGAAVASLHPMRSFARPAEVVDTFAGTFCTIEGDASAVRVLEEWFSACGARVVTIDRNVKPLYHAAGVFACNYLVTLTAIAEQLLEAAGVAEEDRRPMLAPLIRETVDNWAKSSPPEALTGPIVRGDEETVRRHLESLSDLSPALADLYRRLGAATLSVALQAGLPEPTAERLRRILGESPDFS